MSKMRRKTSAKTNKEREESKYDNTNARRTSSRRRSSGAKGRQEKDKVDSTNDPSWYSASPELLRDAASIPFSWPTGTRLDTNVAIDDDTVPGLMALTVVPTIGSQTTMNSPINVASNAIYSFVRHANSGHSNYDAPDLMIYLLAMSHIYSFVTWCQRLLGIVNMYDQRNRYTPYALISANHVSFEDLKNNIANFRYWLNNYITKVASLAVPATMNVFSRLAFLYSNVYIDGPSIKDQLYMYVPDIEGEAWMKFSLDSNQVGQLEWESFTISGGGSYASVQDIINHGNKLFNAIWDQEDFGIMSGDILKAYGDNIVKLATVPVDFNLMPVYDTMVLHQIKNASVCGELNVSKITQGNGILSQIVNVGSSLSTVQQRIQMSLLSMNKVLSSDFAEPGPDVVIESTRLMVSYDSFKAWFVTGTEYVKHTDVWLFKNNGALVYNRLGLIDDMRSVGVTFTFAELLTIMHRNNLLHMFKYSPEHFQGAVNSDGTLNTGNVLRVWDIDNYAVLNPSDISKMHEAALMSLFAVPAIAKIS